MGMGLSGRYGIRVCVCVSVAAGCKPHPNPFLLESPCSLILSIVPFCVSPGGRTSPFWESRLQCNSNGGTEEFSEPELECIYTTTMFSRLV